MATGSVTVTGGVSDSTGGTVVQPSGMAGIEDGISDRNTRDVVLLLTGNVNCTDRVDGKGRK